MDQHQIANLRSHVSCTALLDDAGFKVDAKESTRRAIKYRRGKGQIVIVIHDGHGWFDPSLTLRATCFRLRCISARRISRARSGMSGSLSAMCPFSPHGNREPRRRPYPR